MSEGDGPKRLPKVKADPIAELPIYNFKYLQNTEEMHMADRGIDKIRGFENFPCLEVLWLQDNQITALNHLDKNFRLKRLYVSGNKIGTLASSSLRHLPSLEVLLLANNQITDLKVQLRQLRQLPCLQQLELLGNPVGEETHYRYQIIHRCPSIHILDRHVITDVERLEAYRLAQEYNWDAKPEAVVPEDLNLALFEAGQNVKLKKRGVHLQAAKLPRMWRKRPCFARTYAPPHVKPVKWKSGVASLAELDLDKVNAAVIAHRRREAFRQEKIMYAGLGPPMKGSFIADFAEGKLDESTAQQQAFYDDLKLTKEHIEFEPYPPWDPPNKGTKKLPKPAKDPRYFEVSKKKDNGTPSRTGTPATDMSYVEETILLDKRLFDTYRKSQRHGKVKFSSKKFTL